ncbi:aspartate aminotransferase family protein, partial [Mycobacterium kansasii]
GMVENAAAIGNDIIRPALEGFKAAHPSVGDVRGEGVFFAIELVRDKETREPLAPYGGSSPAMNETVAALKKGGLLPFANYNRIHVVPPCNVSA